MLEGLATRDSQREVSGSLISASPSRVHQVPMYLLIVYDLCELRCSFLMKVSHKTWELEKASTVVCRPELTSSRL